MIKRTLTILTLLAVIFATVGLSAAPVAATPAAADTSSPNAKLLPANTAVYIDLRTADLTKTVTFALDTVEKITGFRPGDPYAQIDQGLTQALGRKATFQKDVLSWLGDHITIGFAITDEDLAALKNKPSAMGQMFNRPNILAVISVKDDAAAKAFLTEVIDKNKSNVKFTSRTDTVGGDQVTIYEQSQDSGCPTSCGSIVLAKGFVAVGLTSAVNNMLDTLKAKKPTLADDATFGKLMGALKPNNLATVYISPRLYQVQLAGLDAAMAMSSLNSQATPDATATANAGKQREVLKAVFNAIKGQAFGARMDGKLLALDVAQSIDVDALSKLAPEFGLPANMLNGAAMKPVEGKLVGQVSNKALAVLVASGIPTLYDSIRGSLRFAGQFSSQMGGMRGGPDVAQIEKGFRQFEAALKLAFDLDLHADVFSWMGGEFALYMTYNPTGTLSKLPKNSWPFDHTLLIQTSDAAKTKTFLTKLNAGIEKNAKGQATVKPAGDNLYEVTGPNGLGVSYGLVGDTFLVTTSSGLDAATAAIKGDGTLTNSPEWKNAQATMVKPTSQIWFVNFAQITPLVKALVELQDKQDANSKQALAALDLLESASISGGVLGKDGLSTASLQITLK